MLRSGSRYRHLRDGVPNPDYADDAFNSRARSAHQRRGCVCGTRFLRPSSCSTARATSFPTVRAERVSGACIMFSLERAIWPDKADREVKPRCYERGIGNHGAGKRCHHSKTPCLASARRPHERHIWLQPCSSRVKPPRIRPGRTSSRSREEYGVSERLDPSVRAKLAALPARYACRGAIALHCGAYAHRIESSGMDYGKGDAEQ